MVGWYPTMKKKERLVNKIKRLIRRAGLPRWLHRCGPKKFFFWQLALGLMIKEVFRLSYRRAMNFLWEYYGISLHWTTLQKCRQRIALSIWKRLLSSTIEKPIEVAAIDGSSMQRTNPSDHYLKRIYREGKNQTPIFFNAMIDVVRRKFISIRHHARRAGEIRDVRYLVEQTKQEIELIVMDKLYDSERLHRYLRDKGIFSIVPVKKNWGKGQIRKQLKDCFDYYLYWQRNLIECLFSALKRLFGTSLRGISALTQRAEIYMRLIAYNLKALEAMIFY